MPNDIWYGADCELRIGVQADADTLPTAWRRAEFVMLRATPQKERRDRGKLGAPRHNPLDPVKPIPGFRKCGLALTIDADTRMVPVWLLLALGAPDSDEDGDLYAHTWESGDVAERYFAIELKTGDNEYRVWRGVSLDSLGLTGAGENTRDFNLDLTLKALDWTRETSARAGATTALPGEAAIYRAQFLVDDAAATHTLQASWSWGRNLVEDTFLSEYPVLAGLRPGGGRHTGTAKFRAMAGEFDALSEDDTVFSPALSLLGVEEDHRIDLIHPAAMLEAPPLQVQGAGLIERDVSWVGHQDDGAPASRIVVVNDVETYA